jgi:hypothetical protein
MLDDVGDGLDATLARRGERFEHDALGQQTVGYQALWQTCNRLRTLRVEDAALSFMGFGSQSVRSVGHTGLNTLTGRHQQIVKSARLCGIATGLSGISFTLRTPPSFCRRAYGP